MSGSPFPRPPPGPGRRWFGGHYRVIPNGVHVDPERAALAALRPVDDKLQIAFVGQAVERKGLPLLLRAFEALREHIPTELTVIGPTEAELAPMMLDARGVRALGKVDEDRKQRVLEAADVLCAPSLGGESFGMVLTEAFAAGTPVVASDIAGYRDVVRDGVDGLLVPVADAQALAEALRDLYDEPSAAPRWRAPPRPTSSGSPGRGSPSRCWPPTRTRSRLPPRRPVSSASRSPSVRAPPT